MDGVLISAAGTFDESMLTGESLPVEHTAGDPLLSGSVNGDDAVKMTATSTAEDSQYSQIVALVQEAASSRPPVVRLADRYAVPFTLLAFALAGLGWYFSQDPGRFAQVLVVATPCPLLIAAPVAFLAGTSRAARSGIIIKNGGTLEQLARVQTAVFDKTGTLTHGRPTLHGIRTPKAAAGLISEDRLLQLAASAEQYSSHVLAASVIGAPGTAAWISCREVTRMNTPPTASARRAAATGWWWVSPASSDPSPPALRRPTWPAGSWRFMWVLTAAWGSAGHERPAAGQCGRHAWPACGGWA